MGNGGKTSDRRSAVSYQPDWSGVAAGELPGCATTALKPDVGRRATARSAFARVDSGPRCGINGFAPQNCIGIEDLDSDQTVIGVEIQEHAFRKGLARVANPSRTDRGEPYVRGVRCWIVGDLK